TLANALRSLGIVLAPFLPDASRKILEGIGYNNKPPRLADASWAVTHEIRLGDVVKVSGLFPRVEQQKAEPTAATAPPRISIADFGKVELRVAEVLAAEALPKSKKLLKLTVSLGDEQRTIVAGIAEHYAPADLVGKKVVVVANLEPAKLMGVQSQGMLLAG